MAFDGITALGIVTELNECLIGGKINKIFQPNKNEIIICVYSNGVRYSLNINVGSSNYRISLTSSSKPNPISAPNFCMVLRKYLIGSKIANISMDGLERIITLDLEAYNELNDLATKKLVVELMGKHSNILLLNENGRIIDAIKHFAISSNSSRPIVPSYEYIAPPTSNKIDFTSIKNFEDFCTFINFENKDTLTNLFSSCFIGISKNFMKYCIQSLQINNLINKENLEKTYNFIKKLINSISNTEAVPFENDYMLSIVNKKQPLQINFFIDAVYSTKEKNDEFIVYRNNVSKLILSHLKKLQKKLITANSKLHECKDMDKMKLYGELITSNLYRLQNEHSNSIILEDYYNNNAPISIPLDPTFSIQDNAKKYFKKYNKLKNTLAIVEKQKQEIEHEILYLESIIYELEASKTIEEVDEIYTEISENVFVQKRQGQKVNKKIKNSSNNSLGEPIKLIVDGYTVLIGKNNKQNDYLTTKSANKDDLWFHTKDIHGSHLILKISDRMPEPSQETINKCASVAAYYSKAGNSSNVPVDYTLVKYVKKPSKAKPGMVTYTNYKTVNVQPNINFSET